jgi:predicted transcriptional regulator
LAPVAFAPDIENEPAREIVTRHFEQEAGFVDAVKRGEDAIESGDYLTHEQVGQRLQRFLQVCAGIRRP